MIVDCSECRVGDVWEDKAGRLASVSAVGVGNGGLPGKKIRLHWPDGLTFYSDHGVREDDYGYPGYRYLIAEPDVWIGLGCKPRRHQEDAKPEMPSVTAPPQWMKWRDVNRKPGHCPCDILATMCRYHNV